MNAGIEGVGGLLILLLDIALAHDTPETDLHMFPGAPKTIVQVKMSKRGIKVITPHQSNRTFAKPHAFCARGRTGREAIGFGCLIGARGIVLAGFALPVVGGGLLIPSLRVERTRRECGRTEKNHQAKPKDTSHDLTVRFSVTS
jgi:hypothetical protein